MKIITGTKKEMTQIFKEDGTVVPVTLIFCEPNIIANLRNLEKDGYLAVQLGYLKAKKANKPVTGQHKETGAFKHLNEFRITKAEEVANFKKGEKVTVEQFAEGDKVKVTGQAKGKGFTGVVKRWGFSGSPASHGHKDQLRMPGSIGAASFPARVIKGKRMGGRVGRRQMTVRGLQIVKIDLEKNEIAVKGAIPGPMGGVVLVSQI